MKEINGLRITTNNRYREIEFEKDEDGEYSPCFKYEGRFEFIKNYIKCEDIKGYNAINPVTAHYGLLINVNAYGDAVKVASYY